MHIHRWAFVIKKATLPVTKPPKKHCCQNITMKSFLFQTMWCVVNAVFLCHHHRTEHFNFSTRRSEFTSKSCICCIPASKSPQEITGCTGFWHFGWHTLHWDCEGDVSPVWSPQEEGQPSSPSHWQAVTAATGGMRLGNFLWLFQGNQGENRQHFCLRIPTYKAGIGLAPWNNLTPHHWHKTHSLGEQKVWDFSCVTGALTWHNSAHTCPFPLS